MLRKKKNKDPNRMRSILSALMRMKFTVRRWVTEIRERKLKQKLHNQRKSHLMSVDHAASSSTEAGTRLPGLKFQHTHDKS